MQRRLAIRDGPGTRKSRVLWIALLLFGSAVLLCFFLLAGYLTDRLPRRTFPDGTTVTLEAVNLGNQEVVRGAWWRKILYYTLPTAARPRAGCRVYRGPGGKALTFHLAVRGPAVPRSHHNDPPSYSTCLGEVDLRDEESVVRRQRKFDFDGDGNEQVCFDAFPRRGKTLQLSVSLPFDERSLVNFNVTNPDPGPHPQWTASPLPNTQQDGDLSVTLTQFEARAHPRDSIPAYLPGWVRAEFEIRKAGKLAPGWSVWPQGFSAPTGDVWDLCSTYPSQGRTARPYLGFDSNTWPEEPVWKVSMVASASAAAPWAPSEVWTVRGVPIPDEGQARFLDRRGQAQGVDLELVSIAGRKSLLPGSKDYESAAEYTVPRLLLRADWKDPRRRCAVFVYARDGRGALHEVPGIVDTTREKATAGTGDFWLHDLHSARKVDLLVIVHRQRLVEFLVRNPFLKSP